MGKFSVVLRFWRRKGQLTAIFLPGEFRGEKSLVGYSPLGRKQLDMTEWQTHWRSYLRRQCAKLYHNFWISASNWSLYNLAKPCMKCLDVKYITAKFWVWDFKQEGITEGDGVLNCVNLLERLQGLNKCWVNTGKWTFAKCLKEKTVVRKTGTIKEAKLSQNPPDRWTTWDIQVTS